MSAPESSIQLDAKRYQQLQKYAKDQESTVLTELRFALNSWLKQTAPALLAKLSYNGTVHQVSQQKKEISVIFAPEAYQVIVNLALKDNQQAHERIAAILDAYLNLGEPTPPVVSERYDRDEEIYVDSYDGEYTEEEGYEDEYTEEDHW